MAYFAEMDDAGTVLRVIVVHDNDAPDEPKGIAFCRGLFGEKTRWAQTSYTGKERKNYAGPGYTLDAKLDAFVPPKPREDAVLDEQSARWIEPDTWVNPE